MSRLLLLLPFALVACKNDNHVIGVDDTDGASLDSDEPDFSEYDGANLRITSPKSGAFLALEETHDFAAQVTDATGAPMTWDDITWSSDADAAWLPTGAAFTDDTLGVGIHDITAETTLPNGDRLAHTIGGVLVQSIYAGTYVGLFQADITYQTYTATCSGAATLVVEPYGKKATGSADCVISLNGYDLPATYTFDLDNDAGVLTGTANADLGFFQVPFDATGTLDVDTETMDITFGGEVTTDFSVDASVDTTRISLDAGT